MNKESRRKSRQNKNKNKRSKGINGTLSGVTTQPLIFPAMFRGKQTYSTSLTLSATAGAPTYNTWRLNSVYDPDLTNVGTVAAGYTQLSALYGRYRVMQASVELEIMNTGASYPGTAFLSVTPTNTVGTDITKILAGRFVWFKGLATNAGQNSIMHKIRVPIHRVYGVPAKQVRIEDDFAAVTGSNPNNVVYLHAGLFNEAGAAGSFNIKVRIVYDVVWSLPLELTY